MIRIGTEYEITTDERNYFLWVRHIAQKGKHKGEEKRTIEGYYPTLERVLMAIVDRNTINGLDGEYGLATALKRVAEIHANTLAEIRAALNETQTD